jgi:hypothetical protein
MFEVQKLNNLTHDSHDIDVKIAAKGSTQFNIATFNAGVAHK